MTQSHLRSEIYVKMLKKKKKRCSTYHPYITSDNWKDTCTPTFTAALFTITKVQKQAQCCLTDEWMNKKEYISIHWIILPWKWVKSQYMSHHGRALRALGWKRSYKIPIFYTIPFVWNSKHGRGKEIRCGQGLGEEGNGTWLGFFWGWWKCSSVTW